MSMLSQLFGGNKSQQQQQAQQQQVQQVQQTQTAHVQDNPTIPKGTEPGANPNPQTQATQSPTDNFSDLWNTSNQQPNQAPDFKLNPEQLQQVTGKMDFTRNLNREDLAAIAQGGDAAVTALGNILNGFGRELFGASAQFSSHMTENGYKSASQIIDQGLPGLVRSQMTEQHLYTSNPKLKDPALQPLVGAMQSQFSAKYPNASPQEITDMVSKYFTTVVGGAFAKAEDPATAGKNAVPASADFSSFLL